MARWGNCDLLRGGGSRTVWAPSPNAVPPGPPPPPQGCIRKEGTPEAVRQAVWGGRRSGWGAATVGYKCHWSLRLALGVTGTVAGHRLGAPKRGGGGTRCALGKRCPLPPPSWFIPSPVCVGGGGAMDGEGLVMPDVLYAAASSPEPPSRPPRRTCPSSSAWVTTTSSDARRLRRRTQRRCVRTGSGAAPSPQPRHTYPPAPCVRTRLVNEYVGAPAARYSDRKPGRLSYCDVMNERFWRVTIIVDVWPSCGLSKIRRCVSLKNDVGSVEKQCGSQDHQKQPPRVSGAHVCGMRASFVMCTGAGACAVSLAIVPMVQNLADLYERHTTNKQTALMTPRDTRRWCGTVCTMVHHPPGYSLCLA